MGPFWSLRTTPTRLATDGVVTARRRPSGARRRVDIERACGDHLLKQAFAAGARQGRIESHVLTVDGFHTLSRRLDGWWARKLVRAAGIVERLREIRTQIEIACCGWLRAGRRSERTGGGGCAPGRTRAGRRPGVGALMLDHGADGNAFGRSSQPTPIRRFPHHRPTDAVLRTGDFVRSTSGRVWAGYHSDMTRVVLGRPRIGSAGSTDWWPPTPSRPGGMHSSRGRPQ